MGSALKKQMDHSIPDVWTTDQNWSSMATACIAAMATHCEYYTTCTAILVVVILFVICCCLRSCTCIYIAIDWLWAYYYVYMYSIIMYSYLSIILSLCYINIQYCCCMTIIIISINLIVNFYLFVHYASHTCIIIICTQCCVYMYSTNPCPG